MRIEQQLRELFNLSLQINGAQFDHNPQAKCIHIYKFPYVKVLPVKYEFNINGMYDEWVPKSHESSLHNAIKNAKELIENQNK